MIATYRHAHLSTSPAMYTASFMPVKMSVLQLFLIVVVSCVEILFIYFEFLGL